MKCLNCGDVVIGNDIYCEICKKYISIRLNTVKAVDRALAIRKEAVRLRKQGLKVKLVDENSEIKPEKTEKKDDIFNFIADLTRKLYGNEKEE